MCGRLFPVRPNTNNLGSNGNVPIAILSTPTFDATTVNPSTATLADAHVTIKGNGGPMTNIQDFNGDGLLDILVHVDTEGLQLSSSDSQAVLLGRKYDGSYISGFDTVRVVK